jgi:hypothetical protein
VFVSGAGLASQKARACLISPYKIIPKIFSLKSLRFILNDPRAINLSTTKKIVRTARIAIIYIIGPPCSNAL